MKQLLYIDMDSTIFNFIFQYSKHHFMKTGQRILPLLHELSKSYHFHDIYGISDHRKYDYLTVEFFETMRPYPNAIETIDKLSNKFDIKFTTHCVTPYAYEGKVRSLSKWFDWFDLEDNIIVIKDKHLLRPSIIIDDNPYVLNSCKNNNFITIKYSQPWNKDITSSYSVYNWREVEQLFNETEFITRN
jgi:5'(3')-deoxyribonucleotidase